ncbi:hypothetical protein BDF21DRAFT_419852 [Thamnidium elegans]|uniref:Coiled-coil domain-containing protein 47 n=1 Tax=Thamnidium elegans TaxID=101142 RepID=A0A8H7VP17_9FUNG|nr:hypothetical protein INT48_004185 [Thamnidium elegans]KAI8079297.1 hypothetical protein BDF21DRAFT_419852 [Thamnidium elegans]
MSKLLSSLAMFALASYASAEEKTPVEAPVNPILTRPLTIHDFHMEIVLSITFLALAFVWFQGKTTNLKKAKIWVNDQIEFLESQFALVGDKLSNEKSVLMVDGPADFLLYTSGRRNVQFGHWWLKMKPRNDILTFFTTQVLALVGYAKPATDRVNLTMALDKAIPEKFVFAVIKKDLANELHQKRFDLKRVGKVASSKVLPANLTIYAETQKLADTILAGKVGEILAQTSDRLESLIISSLPEEEPEMFEADNFLTVSLNFLMSSAPGFDSLVELACELPDVIGQLRLTGDIKSKINKNRDELVKEFSKKAAADRAEELQKKKAEAKRAEEERVKKMSPAEQRKWEEKERARNMKKQQKKKKM